MTISAVERNQQGQGAENDGKCSSGWVFRVGWSRNASQKTGREVGGCGWLRKGVSG